MSAESLYIVRPVTITNAILDSTDVPENDYAAYASGTTYALGDRVIRSSTHKIYESLQNSNIGNIPENSPTWWVEVSATNAWKLFDDSNSSQTVQTGSMSYTLTPGQVINTVGALNLVANSIRIRLVDAVEGTVYDETTSLTSGLPNPDWYNYFFADVPRKDFHVATNLPAYVDADVIIDIEHAAGSDAKCGVLIIGYKAPVGGGIEYGTTVGIRDYSRKENDDWGETVLVKRAYSKWAEFPMSIASNEVDIVVNMLAAVRATPCLWIGSQDYSSTVIFGFYKDFNIVISYPRFSDCTIEVEGLT